MSGGPLLIPYVLVILVLLFILIAKRVVDAANKSKEEKQVKLTEDNNAYEAEMIQVELAKRSFKNSLNSNSVYTTILEKSKSLFISQPETAQGTTVNKSVIVKNSGVTFEFGVPADSDETSKNSAIIFSDCGMKNLDDSFTKAFADKLAEDINAGMPVNAERISVNVNGDAYILKSNEPEKIINPYNASAGNSELQDW